MSFLKNTRHNKTGIDGKMLSEINVTPFVDVMLVLLIIFMITSPMIMAGVDVDLPESKAKPVQPQNEPLFITIDKNLQIYIAETKTSEKELASKLAAITNENYDTRIYIRGDQNVSYGKVMQIIGEINNAGFKKVAMVSNPT